MPIQANQGKVILKIVPNYNKENQVTLILIKVKMKNKIKMPSITIKIILKADLIMDLINTTQSKPK
jgi:hypothetical protein